MGSGVGDPASSRSADRQSGSAVPRHEAFDDPRVVAILAAEHWSLLSTRTLGTTEVLARASLFVALVSGTVIALSFLAQATGFGPNIGIFALLLMSVTLFIGLTTFSRCVVINQEDAVWLSGMNRIRVAYLEIAPSLGSVFVTGHDRQPAHGRLGEGRRQRLANLASSLTTTSGVIAALDSVLAGAIATILASQLGWPALAAGLLGLVTSIVSAFVHVACAARYRERHALEMEDSTASARRMA